MHSVLSLWNPEFQACEDLALIFDLVETGDVFLTDWDSLLGGVQAVVSTLGKLIGTGDELEKINGEANIIAVNAAKKAGEY